MPEIKLKIDDLVLDHDNPRISHADGQQEALQKIVKDQKRKLVKLAESVAMHGLNPMDNLLVLRRNDNPPRFIALEGNRRVSALTLLNNPAVMSGLEISESMRKAIESLARDFYKGKVEPISCFELASRQEGDYWLELRHKGENQGMGIVDWTPVASQRFRGRSPAIQALELVTERGGLSQEQQASIAARFPLSTLQRFMEDRKVREKIGLDVKKGKLVTRLPALEVVKPLKRIVLDLAEKSIQVGSVMKTGQMLGYIDTFGTHDAPDLTKATDEERTVDEIPISEFKATKKTPPRRRPDPSDRREVVPKGCPVQVSDNRIAEIYKELRTLKLVDAPNGIAVLLRVFLELSVDHFLDNNGSSPSAKTPNGKLYYKKLEKKLAETVQILISVGVAKRHFDSIKRDLSNQNSPMNVDLFHRYVHDRFATPTPTELKAAWDHAQPLFEKIWP